MSQVHSRSRPKSPYTLSYGEQIKLCLERGFWRLKADPSLTLSQLFGNIIMGLIVSSVFYNLPTVSDSGEERMAKRRPILSRPNL
jgi:ATP-binding cassette subfamily G (WHITE) protein 2 (PDR)